MKRIVVIAMLAIFGSAIYAATPTDVSEKVLKIFKSTFSSAKDVKWTEYDNNYSVSFSLEGVQSKVVYDKDGNMMSSLRYYSPERLPVNVYSKLKKKFDNKVLYGVTEASTDQEIVYYIKMYDAKNWYTIKMDGSGSMEVYEKLKRADIGQFPEKTDHNK